MKCLDAKQKRTRTESRQERRIADCETAAISKTLECVVGAAMLVLIDEFGFGTRPRADARLPRFVEGLRREINASSLRYDDAILEGIRNKLHNRGVDMGV